MAIWVNILENIGRLYMRIKILRIKLRENKNVSAA